MTLDDRDTGALIALAGLSRVGPAALLRALDEGPMRVWSAVVSGRPERTASLGDLDTRGMAGEAASMDPDEQLERHRAHGREVAVLGDPGYPARLAAGPSPPALLFGSGPMAEVLSAHRPIAAIVGTRNATRAGRELANSMGRDLAEAGVVVVSGLALGIDGAAHRGALAATRSAPVVGVVAAGLDIAYPRRHADLHRQVVERGLLVSETPLGCRPTTWRFPARNRIIAGVSDVVVVVESRAKGGSMLTAGEATTRGVDVLAVPGHPTAPSAAGTNALIADGAGLARDATDVLDALGIVVPTADQRPLGASEAVVDAPLEVRQRSVLDALGEQPAALEEVVVRTRLTVEEAAGTLIELELLGLVSCESGWYERTTAGMGR